MATGFTGTFVISWSQTEVDGFEAAPVSSLTVGAAWSWQGEPVRVDGPSTLLRLDRAEGETNTRKRAARMVRRLIGAAVSQAPLHTISDDVSQPMVDSSFVVTNGLQSFTVTLIEVGNGAAPLLMFVDDIPPRGTDLWIVHHTLEPKHDDVSPGLEAGGVICFTPGTRIATPAGQVRVEDLREGDSVQTKDSGAQEIRWIGSRRMSGARLFAVPALRPIRILAGALGIERPDDAVLVSPEHRMLVRGPVARALFNTPEVLVAAKDLVNGRDVIVDRMVREVTYVHLLLPRHEVLFANGVETESFHPAHAALSTLSDTDRTRLLALIPGVSGNPHSYGDPVRRNLSSSEAAILLHEAA